MNRRERDKLFSRTAESIGEDVIEIVRRSHTQLRRAHPRAAAPPWIESYGDATTGGIFLTQGDDEIWLTHAQARRLRNQLDALYPRKGSKR